MTCFSGFDSLGVWAWLKDGSEAPGSKCHRSTSSPWPKNQKWVGPRFGRRLAERRAFEHMPRWLRKALGASKSTCQEWGALCLEQTAQGEAHRYLPQPWLGYVSLAEAPDHAGTLQFSSCSSGFMLHLLRVHGSSDALSAASLVLCHSWIHRLCGSTPLLAANQSIALRTQVGISRSALHFTGRWQQERTRDSWPVEFPRQLQVPHHSVVPKVLLACLVLFWVGLLL